MRAHPLVLGLLAVMSVARTTRAEAPLRWNLDARVGYGAAWTTGQSYLGLGSGLAGGVTFRTPIHVELGAVVYSGSIVSAANGTMFYWSRDWSVLVRGAVGYDFAVAGTGAAPRFVLRPQVVAGGVFIADTTRFGADVHRSEVQSLVTFGPGAAALVQVGEWHLGVDGSASFVPSRVAAPIGAVYGVFGVVL
jgi:hypothetical protein